MNESEIKSSFKSDVWNSVGQQPRTAKPSVNVTDIKTHVALFLQKPINSMYTRHNTIRTAGYCTQKTPHTQWVSYRVCIYRLWWTLKTIQQSLTLSPILSIIPWNTRSFLRWIHSISSSNSFLFANSWPLFLFWLHI